MCERRKEGKQGIRKYRKKHKERIGRNGRSDNLKRSGERKGNTERKAVREKTENFRKCR